MIRVGTSGYSYDDWAGRFYPPGLPPAQRLVFYAERFDTVEVNTTFYRQPTLALTRGLAAKVGPGFRFSIKVWGGLTHDHEHATEADFRRFAASLAPLVDTGHLGCILAQFPNSFRPQPGTLAWLARVREAWPAWPLAVEFRHGAWHTPATYARLRELDLGVCNVDEPDLPGLMPRGEEITARVGYVRFHGRNAERWYRHQEAWQRYDYQYRQDELATWLDPLKRMARTADSVYVFFNNHYAAQAVTNAGDLLAALAAGAGSG